MIQAIIFDVGGVLLRTYDHRYRREWDKRLGLASGESEELVFNSPTGQAAQAGRITYQALHQWVVQQFNLSGEDAKQFWHDFWAGDDLDLQLIALIRSLRPGYQTAIISNAWDNLHWLLTEKYPIADAFDLIVGSAYEKIMKPDPEIYRRTLARLGRRPEEALFIDDNEQNVLAARALGMAAIHFNPLIDLPAHFAQLGIQLNSLTN